MMSLEKLNDYIDRLELTNILIAQHYIKDDGKPATRQFIGQIRNGTDDYAHDVYRKLIRAINSAQQAKKKEIISKAIDTLDVQDLNGRD